jgi:phosphonate transport system ATP-binding protein
MSHATPGQHGAGPTRAVSVSGLRKRFGSGPAVFEGLSLDVGTGEAVAVIGANGTGKSTLMRALIRLTEVDDGSIDVLGATVRQLGKSDLRTLRARVGFVFQKHNLVSRLSALSNVVHGAQCRQSGPRVWAHWLARTETREEAMHCLARVGLADRALQRVDSLSGGQSQRVAIARMLMQRPELVIADEPDASLDPKAGAEIMDLLFNLTREMQTTLIFVSHHMEHATAFADRIVGLGNGRVMLDTDAASAAIHDLKDFFHEKVAA